MTDFINSVALISLLCRFKMSMLHIDGVSACNDSFSVAFTFLSSEREEDYDWALNHIKSIFRANQMHDVIVRDRELALIAVLRTHFSNARNLLCVWHTLKNVLANYRKKVLSQQDWETFEADFKQLCYSNDVLSYETKWADICKRYPTSVCEYTDRTWLCCKYRFILAWTKRTAILEIQQVIEPRESMVQSILGW